MRRKRKFSQHLKRKRKRSRKIVIQEHHIKYEAPEIKVRIYKGEHWLISLLSRRKKVSKGFIRALKIWIQENEAKAVEL